MKPLAVVLMLVFVAPASFGDDSGILDRRLVDAAARGDLGAVEALVAAGADPNAGIDGYPALQLAVRDGTVEIVQALLAAGADVNAFGEWVPGCCQDLDTALHQAVRYWDVCVDRDFGHCSERTEVIQVLLAAGADVDARKKLGGWTPLHAAANEGTWSEVFEMLLMLLYAGADPNARTEHGRTPLHLAVKNISSAAVVATLVDAGAEVAARDEFGQTPLHSSAHYNESPAVVAALVDAGADIKARDMWGSTPLRRVRCRGSLGEQVLWLMRDFSYPSGVADFCGPGVGEEAGSAIFTPRPAMARPCPVGALRSASRCPGRIG